MSRERTGLRVLPIANVYPNPDQPRKLFEQGAIEELAESIKQHGLVQPIKVCPDGKGEFKIIAGERRYRAHMHLGWATIRAIVETVTDDELADQAIIENLQRKDITPMEEARAFQRRLDSGISPLELAKRLGMKQPHRITERVALLALAPEFQDAFEKRLITPSQATEMSRLNHGYQRLLCDAIRSGRCRTYQELRAVSIALQTAQKKAADAPLRLSLVSTGGSQQALFGGAEASSEERSVLTALEARIEKVVELLNDGIKDNEVVIASKVSAGNADAMAEKLELIEMQLRKLRLALRAAAATKEVA